MATLSNLSAGNLALKGAGTEYNYLQRFFATKAEADAALADGSWTPTAGKLNGCLTGDQGFLVYNEGTSSLDVADEATRAYIDAQIGALVGDAPEVLDTLGEISDALNDNPNYFTDAAAATAANTALINAEAARALASEQAIQADVDQNEADADSAIATLDTKVDDNEADIEDKVSDVNAALGITVGDTGVEFSEDLLLIDLPTAPFPDYNTVFTTLSVDTAETAQTIDVKTALERFARNSRVALRAEKIKLDAEDVRISTLTGISSEFSTLGSFSGSTITTDTDIKTALQELETATETEISDRQAAIADILDGATFTGDIQFGALARIKESGNELKIQNDAQSSSIVLGPKISLQPATGSRIELFETVRMPDGTDLTVTGAELNLVGDLGTFTKDIISDNVDIKDALQELESSVASIQGAAKVHNYMWSNNNDATITAQHITTDAANWADATKVYIHRQARHSVDMQNAFNNMLNVGAKFYIQRTDIGDKFFTAIINSAPTITGSGTDQVFAYDVTDVSTIGQVFNENMRVNVGVFSNVNEKMLDDGLALKANKAGDTFTGVVTVQDHLIVDDSNNIATEYNLNIKSSGSSVFGVLGNGAVLLGNNSGAPFIASADHHATSKKYVDDAIANLVDSAPGTLDTLNELASALGDDPNFSTTITDLVGANETHIDNMATLTGVAKDSVVLGAFTGSTLDDNETVKSALQDLETAVESKLDASAVSTFGGTLVDDADAAAARTTLGVDAAGTDNSTDVTIAAGSHDYITLSGQELTVDHIDLVDDVTNVLPLASGGTGSNTAAGARTALGLGTAATTASTDYATAAQGNTADAALPAAGAQAALSVDHLITLSGVAEAADDLGTFSGSTISDSGTVKAALQELETAVEATPALATAADTVKTQVAANNATHYLTFVDSNNVANTAEALRTGTHLKFNPNTNFIDATNCTLSVAYLTLDSTNVTATALELNVLDGITASTAELNILDGVTATAAELNYVDGVTSNIQTQLDDKAAASDVTTLQTHTGNQEATLGVAATANNLGTFTGSTINDNVNVKQALQALETAQEATQADVNQNESDADAAIAAVLAGTSIPGPFNNDADAASNSVAVGAIYKNSNGTIHWRVS